jgi:16S rRNA (cytosine1402-N4)-methyltransferase
MSHAEHAPVMVDEVVSFLGGRPVVVDFTLGLGGHSRALLDAGVQRIIGVDRDPAAADVARDRLGSYGDRVLVLVSTFSAAPDGLDEPVDGALYDLGVSSMQIDSPERGFGYRVAGPLDMRMGADGPTAADVVNTYSEDDLGQVVREYGEERHWRRVARAIVRARAEGPIRTTDDLARVVAGAVPKAGRNSPHPARRTFQALRIAVNRELEELAASLPRATELLAPGGRIVVISYHSLEDRIVKRYFLGEERLQVLTKKPVRASEGEVARNPRARAAKLRAAERVEPGPASDGAAA